MAFWEKATVSRKISVQVLLGALKECTKARQLEMGKQVHAQAVECGHDRHIHVANAIINMYAKCGSMVAAREVFDSMESPTVVSWNSLILGYVDNGQAYIALDLFTGMKTEGLAPDSVTLVAAIKACISLAVKRASKWTECSDMGKEIHNITVEYGCNSDVYVQSTLVDMYAKCGNVIDAREVFDGMKHLTVVSWNVLISGYTDNGQGQAALEMLCRMRIEGLSPNSLTLVASLKACSSFSGKEGTSIWVDCSERGKGIHNIVVENGCNSDVYVQSTLIDMYVKCSNMVDAREVFDGLKLRTVVSWNILILGYADNEGHTALNMFTKMRTEGPAADSLTFLAVIKACTSLAVRGASRWAEYRDQGKATDNLATENGLSDGNMQSTLVDMYAKCHSMLEARAVFDCMKTLDVVSWTALILGYADNGQGHTALEMFTLMRIEGPAPNFVTFVAALKACTSLSVEGASPLVECRDRGKELHNIAVETGFNSNSHVQSTLLGMYAKCSSMADARDVFDNMKHRDVVSWTVLIMGYADNEQGQTALHLFNMMRTEGHAPDSLTFGAALKACGLVGAIEFGRKIHSELENGLHIILVNCLVDFYAKCGSLVEAQSVFDLHVDTRDLVTWNALLAGFSNCGDDEAVFRLFEELRDTGFRPDGITFLCILTCCSHAGLVAEGKEWFDSMSTKYGLIPSLKHYACMIDIFGRSNKLDDAMALLECMPCNPDDVTWMTILSACRKWKNVEVGKVAFQNLNNKA